MNFLERAWAGKESFQSAMVNLIVLPFILFMLIKQGYGLLDLKSVPIFYHLYNIWIFATLVWMGMALICVWKCAVAEKGGFPTGQRLTLIIIAALFTFILPVIGNLMMFNAEDPALGDNQYTVIEKSMSAPFEHIEENNRKDQEARDKAAAEREIQRQWQNTNSKYNQRKQENGNTFGQMNVHHNQ